MDWHQFNYASVTNVDPERALRCCLLRSLRELRRSVQNGRPMSLPNLLRLFRRRWAEGATGGNFDQHLLAGLARLRFVYGMEQPFGQVNWRKARRLLRWEDPMTGQTR